MKIEFHHYLIAYLAIAFIAFGYVHMDLKRQGLDPLSAGFGSVYSSLLWPFYFSYALWR